MGKMARHVSKIGCTNGENDKKERTYFKIGSYDFFDKIIDLNVGNAFLVKPS